MCWHSSENLLKISWKLVSESTLYTVDIAWYIYRRQSGQLNHWIKELSNIAATFDRYTLDLHTTCTVYISYMHYCWSIQRPCCHNHSTMDAAWWICDSYCLLWGLDRPGSHVVTSQCRLWTRLLALTKTAVTPELRPHGDRTVSI